MKKFWITLLALLLVAVLLFIGAIVYSYFKAGPSDVPDTRISAAGQEVSPDSYRWSIPILGGITYREFEKEYQGEMVSLGQTGEGIPLDFPEGYQSLITVWHVEKDGKEASDFEGSAEAYKGFSFAASGEYTVDITLVKPENSGDGYGQFHYRVTAAVQRNTVLLHSAAEVAQGDVFALELKYVPDGIIPTAETEVSKVSFAREGESWKAYLGISYLRNPGEYRVAVRCGEDFSEELAFRVVEGDFEVQNLTIDSAPGGAVAEAASEAAYAQFRAAIYPLYEEADSEIYWAGRFIEPVEEYRISTTYGVKRYTNGAKTPGRHAGTDLAAPKGTPVRAPAAGRVAFAQYLLNTGNTVAIEHGAGLKTFYFHMDSLCISEGDMVEQGQQIGTVGTTGYSTGPHLHFEMRLANQAIDPFSLINGTGGFFELPELE